MSNPFTERVHLLKESFSVRGNEGSEQRFRFLKKLSSTKLVIGKVLLEYHSLLLFACAFPDNKAILTIAEKELSRLSFFMKRKTKVKTIFLNSGLPFTNFKSCFTHDFVKWLTLHPDCKISLSHFNDGLLDLNDVLKLTLSSLEKSETTAGWSNDDLLQALLVKKHERLTFLINELSKLDHIPFIKDQLYDSLNIYCDVVPVNRKFSISYNRIPIHFTYFQNQPLKSFNYIELLNKKVGHHTILNPVEKNELIKVVKNSMALTDRETDTVTYMDENSLRLYALDHGISIAIYGMIPKRQLPLESYVGYTLFKNGFPTAYGGSWIFGERANFGINIFEAYRGGESGYIMCQLLRLYRQIFGISYFEIEPYQFGLDNPDGIKSGAFWFYYRYGFRPLDKSLLRIAESEHKKIKTRNKYHTSKSTLIKFTQSNMALQIGKNIPVPVAEITNKVLKLVHKNYKGNRIKAEEKSVEKFISITRIKPRTTDETQVLKEVALWSEAFSVKDPDKINLLAKMVRIKPLDLYKYQKFLLKFLADK